MEVDNREFIEMVRREKQCVEPDAPYKPCCICGTHVKTCERKEPVNNSYVCPSHPNGCELSDGRWTCSIECWEKAIDDD